MLHVPLSEVKTIQLLARVLSFKQVFHSCIATEITMASTSNASALPATKEVPDGRMGQPQARILLPTALETKVTDGSEEPSFNTSWYDARKTVLPGNKADASQRKTTSGWQN